MTRDPFHDFYLKRKENKWEEREKKKDRNFIYTECFRPNTPTWTPNTFTCTHCPRLSRNIVLDSRVKVKERRVNSK